MSVSVQSEIFRNFAVALGYKSRSIELYWVMLSVKSLFVRTVTGALFVAVIVACILWSEYSFSLLFAIITALSVAEFYRLVAPLHPVCNGFRSILRQQGRAAFFNFCLLNYIFASKTLPHLLQRNFCLPLALVLVKVRGWSGLRLSDVFVCAPISDTSVLPQNKPGHLIFDIIISPYVKYYIHVCWLFSRRFYTISAKPITFPTHRTSLNSFNNISG